MHLFHTITPQAGLARLAHPSDSMLMYSLSRLLAAFAGVAGFLFGLSFAFVYPHNSIFDSQAACLVCNSGFTVHWFVSLQLGIKEIVVAALLHYSQESGFQKREKKRKIELLTQSEKGVLDKFVFKNPSRDQNARADDVNVPKDATVIALDDNIDHVMFMLMLMWMLLLLLMMILISMSMLMLMWMLLSAIHVNANVDVNLDCANPIVSNIDHLDEINDNVDLGLNDIGDVDSAFKRFVNYSCHNCICRKKFFQVEVAKDLHAIYNDTRERQWISFACN